MTTDSIISRLETCLTDVRGDKNLSPTAQALNGAVERLKKLEQIEQIYEEWQKNPGYLIETAWVRVGKALDGGENG